jgi:putative hydrolase of the HAD superfamily
MLRHVFFDFFGTLVDYSPSWVDQGYERSHRILQEAGAACEYEEFLEGWRQLFGFFEARALVSLEEYSMTSVCEGFLANRLGCPAPPALVTHFRDTYLEEWNAGVRYIPGVPALLERLAARYGLALVSNTHQGSLVREHLDTMQVTRLFTSIVTSDEHGRRKPSRCIFERALALSGGAPESTAYVGDSYAADYLGAKGAGLGCVLIDPRGAHSQAECQRVQTILDIEKYLV